MMPIKHFALVALVIRLCASEFLLAQNEPPSLKAPPGQEKSNGLEEISAAVSDGRPAPASKTERLARLSPSALTVITRKQIEETGARSIAEVLRLVPGVNYRMTPMGNFYGIRSFGSTPFSSRVLLLVDGFPFNSPDKGGLSGHPGFDDFFPIEQIRRIEIVKGPATVLYGQNAFQGIINIITRDPEEADQTVVDFLGGARETSRASVTSGGRLNDLGYTLTGKLNRSEGVLEYQKDVRLLSGDAYLRTSYKGMETTYLLHRDTYSPFQLAGGQSLPTEQNLHMLNLSYGRPLSRSWSFRVRALYNRRDGTTCANCHDFRASGTFRNDLPADLSSERETNQRTWFNLQFNYSPAKSRHNLILGTQYQLDNVYKEVVQRLDRDRDLQIKGFFVQDEISLRPSLMATLGTRIDNHKLTGTSASPTAALAYQARSNFVLRALFGRAYREPTWNEFFINQRFLPQLIGSSSGLLELRRVGNPQLKPEKVNTGELGVEYYLHRNFSIKADGFYSAVQDYIEAEDFSTLVGFGDATPPRPAAIGPGPTARLALAANRQDIIRTAGAEIEVQFRPLQQLHGVAGYAYQAMSTNATDIQHAYAPSHKVTLMVDTEPLQRLHVNFNMNSSSSFTASTPGLTMGLSPQAPGGELFGRRIDQGYALANVHFSFDLPARRDRVLKLSFHVNNVFGQRVQLNPISGVDTGLRGRELFFGANFKF